MLARMLIKGFCTQCWDCCWLARRSSRLGRSSPRSTSAASDRLTVSVFLAHRLSLSRGPAAHSLPACHSRWVIS